MILEIYFYSGLNMYRHVQTITEPFSSIAILFNIVNDNMT